MADKDKKNETEDITLDAVGINGYKFSMKKIGNELVPVVNMSIVFNADMQDPENLQRINEMIARGDYLRIDIKKIQYSLDAKLT